jgi:hypothetical protein
VWSVENQPTFRRHNFSSKCRLTFNGLNAVISQKIENSLKIDRELLIPDKEDVHINITIKETVNIAKNVMKENNDE